MTIDNDPNQTVESNPVFSSEGGNSAEITMKVKAYYTKAIALQETVKEFGPQIKANLDAFKKILDKKHLKYLSGKDIDDAQSEFYNDRAYVPILERNMHYEFKVLNDVLCRIEYDLYKMGQYSDRRTTYMISNISALYYLANGIGIRMYPILKNEFWMKREIGRPSINAEEALGPTPLPMVPRLNTQNPINNVIANDVVQNNMDGLMRQQRDQSMRSRQLAAQKAATTKRLQRMGLKKMGQPNASIASQI